jgi:hypothetical protein
MAEIYTSDSLKFVVPRDTPVYYCATNLASQFQDSTTRVQLPYSSKDIQHAINFCYGIDTTSNMTLTELSTATNIAEALGMDGYHRRVIERLSIIIDSKTSDQVRNMLNIANLTSV